MYKKSLLGLAIASTLVLNGCSSGEVGGSAGATTPADQNSNASDFEAEANLLTGTFPVFNPAGALLPIPNDLLIQQEFPDGSFSITTAGGQPDTSSPVTSALNNSSGASTSASIDIAMSGLIDEETVDGRALIPNPDPTTASTTPLVPNPNQNVFLIPLTYPSGNPLLGLVNGEPALPAAAIDSSVLATNAYEIEVLTLDVGTPEATEQASTIRIKPTTPLLPNTRYIVAITDGIRDINDRQIHQSPGLAGYFAITNAEGVEETDLGPVRQIITELWEPISVGLFGSTINATRQTLSDIEEATPGTLALLGLDNLDLTPVTADNIAMSYSFTTSNDQQVLEYIADPAAWATDTIRDNVSVAASQAFFGDPANLIPDNTPANVLNAIAFVQGAQAAFTAASFSANLGPLCPTDTFSAGDAQFTCAGERLTEALQQGVFGTPVNFPTPSALSSTFDFDNATDINLVSAVLAASLDIEPGTVNVVEGTLEGLPYFLGTPNDDDGTPITTDNWTADIDIATSIGEALTFVAREEDPEAPPVILAQSDPSISTVVNALFPFPEDKSRDIDGDGVGDGENIPVLAIIPADLSGVPAEGLKTVIFQHGITTDRSAALAFGASIVNQAFNSTPREHVAVIAIDQPLHGISGITPAEQSILAEQLLVGAGILEDDREPNRNSDRNNLQIAIALDDLGEPALTGLPINTDRLDADLQAVVAEETPSNPDPSFLGSHDGIRFDAEGAPITALEIPDEITPEILESNPGAASFTSRALFAIQDANGDNGCAALDGLNLLDPTDFNNALDMVMADVCTADDTTLLNNAMAQDQIDAVVNGIFSAGALALVPAPSGCAFVDALDLTIPNNVLTALGGIDAGVCNINVPNDITPGELGELAGALTGLLSAQTLERTVANAGSTIPGLGQVSSDERHFGFATLQDEEGNPLPLNSQIPEAVSSGAFFIELGNFLASRDNLRQGTLDLLSLRLSLGNMDIAGDGSIVLDAGDPEDDTDNGNVFFIGHSLGTVNGLPFVALTDLTSSTNDKIQAANFLTPGGGVTRLVENSPSFGSEIIAGLALVGGITQAEGDYQTFLNVFQGVADAGDSINFVDKLNTPALFSMVIGDQTIPNAVTDNSDDTSDQNDDTLSTTDIATLLTVANNENPFPVPLAPQLLDLETARQTNIGILNIVLGIQSGVQNIPLGVAEDGSPITINGSVNARSSTSELAGTEPLIRLSEATDIDTTAPNDLTSGDIITRYIVGTHGTPVIPLDDEQTAVFQEMVSQATDMVIDPSNISANESQSVETDDGTEIIDVINSPDPI